MVTPAEAITLTFPCEPRFVTRGEAMPWPWPCRNTGRDASGGLGGVGAWRRFSRPASARRCGRRSRSGSAAREVRRWPSRPRITRTSPSRAADVDASPLQHAQPQRGAVCAAARQHRPDVRLRAHGLRARPHRQLPHLRVPGRAAPGARVRGRPRRARSGELHRRGRQDDRRAPRRPPCSLRDYTEPVDRGVPRRRRAARAGDARGAARVPPTTRTCRRWPTWCWRSSATATPTGATARCTSASPRSRPTAGWPGWITRA